MLTDPPSIGTCPDQSKNERGEKLHVLSPSAASDQGTTEQKICSVGVAHHSAPRLVEKALETLRPLPVYEKLQFQPSVAQLSAISERGDEAFAVPILVTQDGYIIDGNARWNLARRWGRPTLLCLEYELTPEEALRMFLQQHRRIQGLNAFCRIWLAFDLEDHLRVKARSNQQLGGRIKGSSRLTEADHVDVRRQTAQIAGVSVGNVSKVKRILSRAIPSVISALVAGEVSINWASLLVRDTPPQEQQEVLDRYLQNKEVRPQLARLISQHFQNPTSTEASLEDFSALLQTLPPERQREISVIRVQMPAKVVAITSSVVKLLNTQKRMDLK